MTLEWLWLFERTRGEKEGEAGLVFREPLLSLCCVFLPSAFFSPSRVFTLCQRKINVAPCMIHQSFHVQLPSANGLITNAILPFKTLSSRLQTPVLLFQLSKWEDMSWDQREKSLLSPILFLLLLTSSSSSRHFIASYRRFASYSQHEHTSIVFTYIVSIESHTNTQRVCLQDQLWREEKEKKLCVCFAVSWILCDTVRRKRRSASLRHPVIHPSDSQVWMHAPLSLSFPRLRHCTIVYANVSS